ncbi:unnamed protein product [Sphagnum troendelagicum]|uniref:Uncharacterized protein n=1 Tax=Sphagnum troendelagicum TaxID=128251 RepID=A0ABP0U613_9BRYO
MTLEENKVEPPTMTPKEAIYVEVLVVISGGKEGVPADGGNLMHFQTRSDINTRIQGEWYVRVEALKTQVVQKKSTLHEWEKELIGKQEQLHEGEQKLNEREEHIVSIVNH